MNVFHPDNLEIPTMVAEAKHGLMVITYTNSRGVNQWIRQNKLSFETVRSTAGDKQKKAKRKSELRTQAVKDLHDVLGNPSYTTMMNMISHGSIINTSVTN